MNTVLFEKHCPSYNNGTLGCDGFTNTDSIFCLAANGDNNFLNFGIIENSILFVDKSKSFFDGGLNVYQLQDGTFKLSRTELNEEYKGRIIMATNIFDD